MKPCPAPRLWALIAVAFVLFAPLSGAAAQTAGGAAPNAANPAVTPAPEAPSKWYSGSYTVAFASRYLFQGLDYSDGKPVLEPELDFSAGQLTAKCWANHDLNQGVSNEFDLSLEHGWTSGKLSGAVGYTHLHYPHRDGWDPSQEFYVSIAREGKIHTSLAVHYDFDAGTGTYTTLGVNRSVERPFGTVTAGVNLFHQAHYYAATGIPAAELNVNLSKSIGKIALTPSVSRFVTWENGDFRGPLAIASAWVFSLSFAQEF
jgi:hypothetical protein